MRPLATWFPIAVSLAAVLMAAFAAGCGKGSEGTLSRIRRVGTLRVGTDATYPPFESIDPASRQVVGFDADLVRAVGNRLGARVEFLVVPFDGILAALRSGKYDAVISALTITDDRAREVLFSEPYYAAGQSIVVRNGSPVGAEADLPGRRIGVQLGTTGEREAHKIAGAQVVSFDAIGAAFIDLANGRLDAVIADTPTAALFSADHPEIVLVGAPITRESYGIAMRMGDLDLKGAVDGAIQALDRDGTVRSLREKWKLPSP
jgi:polar amino acid transport system substrate-binding protein